MMMGILCSTGSTGKWQRQAPAGGKRARVPAELPPPRPAPPAHQTGRLAARSDHDLDLDGSPDFTTTGGGGGDTGKCHTRMQPRLSALSGRAAGRAGGPLAGVATPHVFAPTCPADDDGDGTADAKDADHDLDYVSVHPGKHV